MHDLYDILQKQYLHTRRMPEADRFNRWIFNQFFQHVVNSAIGRSTHQHSISSFYHLENAFDLNNADIKIENTVVSYLKKNNTTVVVLPMSG